MNDFDYRPWGVQGTGQTGEESQGVCFVKKAGNPGEIPGKTKKSGEELQYMYIPREKKHRKVTQLTIDSLSYCIVPSAKSGYKWTVKIPVSSIGDRKKLDALQVQTVELR
jgi:hypothetical protein